MTTATAEAPAQVSTETGGDKTTLLTGDPTQTATTDQTKTGAEGKTAEQVAAEKVQADKAAAEKAAAEAVPERYDLKLPEGTLLQTADVDRLKAEAKALGLTQAEAQEYLDTHHKAISSFHEAQVKQVDEIHAGWRKDAEADKEIGGEAFKGNVELGKRVVERFGTPEFKRVLTASGLGNHPEVIRVFARIGKIMSEDQFVHASTQTTKPKTDGEILYNHTTGTQKE